MKLKLPFLFFAFIGASSAAWTVTILRVDKGAGKISVSYTLTDSVSAEVIPETIVASSVNELKTLLTNRITQITNLYALAAVLPLGSFDPTPPAPPAPPALITTGTYNALAASVAAGASKDYLNLFNAVGSGKVLSVTSIVIAPANTATVTGSSANFLVSKTSTVGATCIRITIGLLDAANNAVPAQITASSNCTTKPIIIQDFFPCAVTPAQTAAAEQTYCYRREGGEGALTLREGEGLTVRTTALAPVGLVSVAVRFVM